jgi:ATP-dependent helicase HrpA
MAAPPQDTAALLALRDKLTLTRHADRPRLSRELDRLFSRPTGQPANRPTGQNAPSLTDSIARLASQIDTSIAAVERLRAVQLRLDYDPQLPITAHHDEILDALAKHRVIVVCGATGSGKTTQLPKFCIEAGRGTFGIIGHTQPRRIAARALANRLASELATPVGSAVGYQVRFSDRTGPATRVKLMTDGILLRELENDRYLRRYDTLIIDEAHERSLNIDFLLGVLQGIVKERAELKVIITSATIDPQRFADFFGGAPVIEVSGRSFPVEVRYRPLVSEDEDEELSLPEGIIAAVRELDQAQRGDALVFLPGEKQIREAANALGKARLMHTEVLPLYSRLSAADQEKIFAGHSARRVILATNVAETSLTVPGIKYVIDSGLARISRYSVRGKVQRLPIEPISRASAEQRTGRCGRESEGICIRLYAEDEFNLREEFTPPEVLRTNLASVILQMSVLGLGDPENFPFLDPPDTRLINDGYRLLQELEAVDDDRRVTALGRQVAALPVDPRLARMLLAASHHGCLKEMLVITAFLAGQDPRERPQDAQQQADQQHASYADPRSDFVTVLNLWKRFMDQSAALSGGQLRKWCRESFLAYLRMREWQELHRQLGETVAELELTVNTQDANYADLHQAILTGFLGNIGVLDEKREYEGARGTRFVIAPGTPIAAKPPGWVVVGSLVETTRLYARMIAAIEPAWIEAAGAHLVKRQYDEPHWLEERGFVAAFESTSLYGLTLSSRRRVNYGNVAPREAREIFVREALVEGHARVRAPFVDHNRALKRRIESLEAKIRRRDVLIDEQSMVDFYLARLPEAVHSTAVLEKWLKDRTVPAAAHQALEASQADLMQRGAGEVTADDYPDELRIAGNTLPLEYLFEPGSGRDGVTITIPVPVLRTMDAAATSQIVPGWRLEKLTAVLRALPKHLRKAFVPVPDHARQAMAEVPTEGDFATEMAAWITRNAGETITAHDIESLALPEHLRFNIRAIDASGTVVAEGRDLMNVRRASRSSAAEESRARIATARHRRWDFGELPIEQMVERRGLRFKVYPTLRDHGDGVELTDANDVAEAMTLLRAGVVRLATLVLPEQLKYARKRLADDRDLMLLGQGLGLGRAGGAKALADSLAERAFVECFVPADDAALPRTHAAFDALIERGRGAFGGAVDAVGANVKEVLREWRAARQKAQTLTAPAFKTVATEVAAQLETLVPPAFPHGVPAVLWPHLPRFLKALSRRLDKVAGNLKRDAELTAKVQPFVQAWQKLHKSPDRRTAHPELDRLQWMIEELRVSLFAQDLKTALPVSEKRLAEQVEKAVAESRAA